MTHLGLSISPTAQVKKLRRSPLRLRFLTSTFEEISCAICVTYFSTEPKIIEDGSLDELVDRIAPYRQLIIDFYHPAVIQHSKAELVSVDEARAIYKFRKDEITAARLIEDISHSAPIKEVGPEEAKIDDIIRTAYQQGSEL